MSVSTKWRLTLPVPSRRFRQEGVLRKVLEKQDITSLVTLRSVSELTFNKQGCIMGDLRFSTHAMGQLCSWLAPGLSQLVFSLSALGGEQPNQAKLLAIKMINALVQLRFHDQLRDCRLLVDQRARRVDGLVGVRYQLLSNLELLSRTRTLAVGDGAVFHEALLEGRRLMVRYRKVQKAAVLPVGEGPPHVFRLGWHFANSEIGDRSIHAALLLIREGRYMASMAPTTKIDRLIHVQSPDFANRVTELMDRLRGKSLDAQELRDHLSRAVRTRLGLSAGNSGEFAKQSRQLLAKLVRAKLPCKLAQRALNSALVYGSEIHTESPAETELLNPALLEKFGQRTVYDLYSSLTQVAVRQDIKRRELVEQLAYRVLANRFHIL